MRFCKWVDGWMWGMRGHHFVMLYLLFYQEIFFYPGKPQRLCLTLLLEYISHFIWRTYQCACFLDFCFASILPKIIIWLLWKSVKSVICPNLKCNFSLATCSNCCCFSGRNHSFSFVHSQINIKTYLCKYFPCFMYRGEGRIANWGRILCRRNFTVYLLLSLLCRAVRFLLFSSFSFSILNVIFFGWTENSCWTIWRPKISI